MAYTQRAGRDYLGMMAPAQNQSYKLPNTPVQNQSYKLPSQVGMGGGAGGGGGQMPGAINQLTGGAPVRNFGGMDRQQPVAPMRRPMSPAQNQSFRLPNQPPLDFQRPAVPQPYRPPMMAQPQQQPGMMQSMPYQQQPYNLGQQPYQQQPRMDTWGGRGAPDFNYDQYGVMPGNMGW